MKNTDISPDDFTLLSPDEQMNIMKSSIKDFSKKDAMILKKMIDNSMPAAWENIKEEAPDEIDLQMLKAIESDPECHEFVKEIEIDWD